MTNGQQFRGAFITVTSLFFMWGFITVMVDALIPRLKDVFELTYLQAGLVQFAWFTAYGIISIPGGRLIKRLGYKNGILIGLSLAAIGCLMFYPAGSSRLFALFLLALFVVASGITILQVAANPYISVLGPEEGASRLSLAQAFNSRERPLRPSSAPPICSRYPHDGAEQAALTSSGGLSRGRGRSRCRCPSSCWHWRSSCWQASSAESPCRASSTMPGG